MKNIVMAAGAVALGASMAQAGGFERAGHNISSIFEKGNYAEFSLGFVSPTVRNTGVPAPSGDIAQSYMSVSGAVKQDLSDTLSVGLIVDQPWGAHVQYPLAVFGASSADLESTAITGIVRYKVNGGFSVHGGLRYVTIGGVLNLPGVGIANRTFERDGGVGYLVGAAYERPDIALRVALTYFSETDHVAKSTAPVGTGTVTAPDAVNLDFQTGVAANTLVFGQIRWVDWSETRLVVVPSGAPANTVLAYSNDSVTYSLGVGRKFNDTWSGAVSIGYEAAQGTSLAAPASGLGPTDGSKSISIGATYTQGNMKITGGVRYVDIGDAIATTGAFRGNKAIGVGLKVGFTF